MAGLSEAQGKFGQRLPVLQWAIELPLPVPRGSEPWPDVAVGLGWQCGQTERLQEPQSCGLDLSQTWTLLCEHAQPS